MSALPFNMELAVAAFRNARDILKAMDVAHDEAKKPIQFKKDRIEAAILEQLDASGQLSSRTGAGTATKKTNWKASIADKSLFRDFVTKNQLFDLIDWKANVTACRDYTETNKQPPSGVNLSPHTTLSVTRPKTSSAEPQEDGNE